ncbi:recombinase family protein [Methylobacterium sp. 285MFTsu5.1]|uniref:recombinase family protein n=1 Tax=Methylobacterium sp. 285MFTsu5.1 TaxID=1172187 RepID=UPI0009DC18B9|nr:recombinase family protein [Methylobacterium sp. 285MFTsu5.1]
MRNPFLDTPSDRALVIRYHRVSREEQAEGHGFTRQREGTEEWCARNGVEADLTLEDAGHSAFTADHIRRGAMGQILEAIASGRIMAGSTLVMENLDRLSRENPFEAVKMFTSIVSNDIAIVTFLDGYRYTQDGTAMQRMLTMIMSIMHFGRANSESELKSTRVAEAWREKHRLARENGQPHGRRCPEWMRLEPGGYELIEDRAREVRWMFACAIGGWGRRRIVKELIARRVEPWIEPSVKRPHPVWNESYVQKILSGGEACGTYFPGKWPGNRRRTSQEPILDYYPAAVSREIFDQARAAADLRQGGGGRKGSSRNLLQNLCVCGCCGRGMTMQDKGTRSRGPALVCQRSLVGDCEHRFRYVYARAELMVFFCIGDHADQILRSAEAETCTVRGLISGKELQLNDRSERIRRLVKHMEVSADPALDDRLRELREESQSLSAELQDLRHSLARSNEMLEASFPDRLLSLYRRISASPKDQSPQVRSRVNQDLRSFIKRIVFRNGSFTVEFRNGREGRGFMLPGHRPRPNRGHFSSAVKEGIQLRKGEIEPDPSRAPDRPPGPLPQPT